MTRQVSPDFERSPARPVGSAARQRAGRWAFGVLLLLVAQACDCNCGGEVPETDGGTDQPTCVAGTEGCPCDENACGEDLICSNGECVACVFGTDGCPCEEGTCQGGDVCDQTDGTCRQPTACEQAGCAQYQLCEQNPGEDALCLKECQDGYRFVQDTSSCVAIPSCDENDPGFVDCGPRECTAAEAGVTCGDCLDGFVEVDGECVAEGCELLCPGRECEEDSGADGGPPVCGDCLPGFILDAAADECVDLVTCAEANCGPNEFCIEAQLPARNAECRQEASCPTGQVDDGTGACVACVACYNGTTPLEGVAGIANAGYAWGGKCVCDVEPGYFQEIEGGAVKACDADGDGWVNASLELTRQFQGGANPFNANHECTVRRIDRFELWSDDFQPGGIPTSVRKEKVVTVDDLVAKYGLSNVPRDDSGVAYVELLEPSSLDELAAFTERYTTAQSAVDGLLHNYGGHTDTLPDAGPGDDDLPPHRLVASEANPLTKMCNHDDDDLNWDGVPDVEQSHDFVSAAQLRRDTGVASQVFYRMSYFIELNRGFYTDGAGGFGKYVIAEKARLADANDPLEFELALAYPDTGLTDYWQICPRGRSPDYNTGLNDQPPDWNINNDFASWYEECASDVGGVSSGTCEVPDANGRNHVPYDGRALRTEGANPFAQADALSDGSQRWPGMNHSSQFKCVSFAATINPPSSRDHRRPPANFSDNSKSYFLENCRLEPRTQSATPPGLDAANPADPGFACEALDPDLAPDAIEVGALTARPSQNFFVALEPRQRTSINDEYRGGCIDEGIEWQHLCLVQSEPTGGQYFGELFCSCGPSRAGPLCEHGCPDRYLFSDRQGNASTFELEGYWVCMVPTASDGTVLGTPGTGYSIRGHVPAEVTPTEELCEPGADGGCAPSGYRIGPWTP